MTFVKCSSWEFVTDPELEDSVFPGWIFHLLMISTCMDNQGVCLCVGTGGGGGLFGAIDHFVRQEKGKHGESVRSGWEETDWPS